MKNKTKQDARDRLQQARVGCFDNTSLKFLEALRAGVQEWLAAIEDEYLERVIEEDVP